MSILKAAPNRSKPVYHKFPPTLFLSHVHHNKKTTPTSKSLQGSSKAFVFDFNQLFTSLLGCFSTMTTHHESEKSPVSFGERPGVEGSARLPKVLAPLTFVTPQVGFFVWLDCKSERKQLYKLVSFWLILKFEASFDSRGILKKYLLRNMCNEEYMTCGISRSAVHCSRTHIPCGLILNSYSVFFDWLLFRTCFIVTVRKRTQ